MNQGHIKNKEENVRFFLKLLKSSANNFRMTINLTPKIEGEEYEFIYDGKTKQKPRVNIFAQNSAFVNWLKKTYLKI